MASFCKQCSIELFGKDYGELAGLGPEESLKEGEGWLCLCEECGPIVVSQDGTCISASCPKHGKENTSTEIPVLPPFTKE